MGLEQLESRKEIYTVPPEGIVITPYRKDDSLQKRYILLIITTQYDY